MDVAYGQTKTYNSFIKKATELRKTKEKINKWKVLRRKAVLAKTFLRRCSSSQNVTKYMNNQNINKELVVTAKKKVQMDFMTLLTNGPKI